MERKTILHLLTRPKGSLAATIIAEQKMNSGNAVEVVDFTIAEPDYATLVGKIFTADSVEVW